VQHAETASSGGDGTGGPPGPSGGSGGEGEGGDDELLNLEAAAELAAAKGVTLPADFAAAAASGGLRRVVLQQYLTIASGGALASMLARTIPAFRDRLIADRLFLFKVDWGGGEGCNICLQAPGNSPPLHLLRFAIAIY
jgi:hypothetical protein